MSRKVRARPPLLVQVWAELGACRISEGRIDDTDHFVEGVCVSGKNITINPSPALNDVVVHELLHRLHPEWPETYVRNRTTFLLRRMTDDEHERFYDEYQRRKKTRKTRLILE